MKKVKRVSIALVAVLVINMLFPVNVFSAETQEFPQIVIDYENYLETVNIPRNAR